MGDRTEGPIRITREIPIPTSVSPQAQATLRFGFQMGPTTAALPPLDDHAAWQEHVRATDAMIVAGITSQGRPECTVSTRMVGDVPIYEIAPDGVDVSDNAPVYLYIHGGALVYGSGEACRAMSAPAASGSQMSMWSVDYRMPPTHPYPAALDDCIAAYRSLLEIRQPNRIVVGGLSAGGNLAAALLLRAHTERLPMPSCLVLASPEVDLTESGDSFETNLGLDMVLTKRLTESIALYAGANDLADPLLSPLFAAESDLAHFPPTILQAGTRDLFLSNAVRMHRALRRAGVDAELHVFEAMPHGGFFGAPEDDEWNAELRRFITRHRT